MTRYIVKDTFGVPIGAFTPAADRPLVVLEAFRLWMTKAFRRERVRFLETIHDATFTTVFMKFVLNGEEQRIAAHTDKRNRPFG